MFKLGFGFMIIGFSMTMFFDKGIDYLGVGLLIAGFALIVGAAITGGLL